MKRRILVADDSTTIRRVVEHTFAGSDVSVATAADGAAAIELARETRPDLVLCDVLMPGPSGYEVAELLSRDPALAGIPVLLLTGAFEPFDEARATAAGAAGFLAKPFESQVLRDRVLELLAGRPASPAPHAAVAGPGPSAAVPALGVAESAEEGPEFGFPPTPAAARAPDVPEAPSPSRLITVLAGRAPLPEPSLLEPRGATVSPGAAAHSPGAAPAWVPAETGEGLLTGSEDDPFGDIDFASEAWGAPRIALPGDEDFDLSRPAVAPAGAGTVPSGRPVAAGPPGQTGPAGRSPIASELAESLREDMRRELLAIAPDILREIAWEVLPDLLERLLREGLPTRGPVPGRAGRPGDPLR